MARRYVSPTVRRALLTGSIALALLALACGSDDGSSAESAAAATTGPRAIDSERVLSIDDFTAAGFKKSKTYDVEDLPNAQAAYYGFWGLDPYNRDDYEIRFYASQSDAMAHGTELADERTWPDAKLTEETATWKTGIKDARKCEGVLGQSQWAATCTVPKYYDFMFVGNAILFCPGTALEAARQNCDQLLAQLN